MQVGVEISSTWAYTSDATSLKALHRLKLDQHLPLSRGNVLGVEISMLETSEPELDWSCRVAVWRAQYDSQS